MLPNPIITLCTNVEHNVLRIFFCISLNRLPDWFSFLKSYEINSFISWHVSFKVDAIPVPSIIFSISQFIFILNFWIIKTDLMLMFEALDLLLQGLYALKFCIFIPKRTKISVNPVVCFWFMTFYGDYTIQIVACSLHWLIYYKKFKICRCCCNKRFPWYVKKNKIVVEVIY